MPFSRTSVLAVIIVLASTGALFAEKVSGYAEYRKGRTLLVDGQRLEPAPDVRIEGAKSFEKILLGSEITADGARRSDGVVVVSQIKAKPNGLAFMEADVIQATNQAEAQFRQAGAFFQNTSRGVQVVGKLEERGPRVDRVRRIVGTLTPPYLGKQAIRAYVIENKDWNAFAMANGSVYVFSGMLNDMDDDEIAIVVGHELAHATHEHSRRGAKKNLITQAIAVGAIAGAQTIDNKGKRAATQALLGLSAAAYSSGHGREMEDQADRVGLRYAYEGGWNVRKGPRLWQRFAQKYGEGDKVSNFFFSDHSQASARARNLEREIANNYR